MRWLFSFLLVAIFSWSGFAQNASSNQSIVDMKMAEQQLEEPGDFISVPNMGQRGVLNVVNTFPFNESFEDASPTRADWTQIQEAGAGSWTYGAGSVSNFDLINAAQDGVMNARFVSSMGTNTPITKLVTPVLDLSAYASIELEFLVCSRSMVWRSKRA